MHPLMLQRRNSDRILSLSYAFFSQTYADMLILDENFAFSFLFEPLDIGILNTFIDILCYRDTYQSLSKANIHNI